MFILLFYFHFVFFFISCFCALFFCFCFSVLSFQSSKFSFFLLSLLVSAFFFLFFLWKTTMQKGTEGKCHHLVFYLVGTNCDPFPAHNTSLNNKSCLDGNETDRLFYDHIMLLILSCWPDIRSSVRWPSIDIWSHFLMFTIKINL